MAEQKSYAQKLKDPRWQKMRLEVMERDGFTCQACRTKEKTLNVHHTEYTKNGNPWDVPVGALVTLCEDCHQFQSLYLIPSIKDSIARLRPNIASSLVEGLAIEREMIDKEGGDLTEPERLFLICYGLMCGARAKMTGDEITRLEARHSEISDKYLARVMDSLAE